MRIVVLILLLANVGFFGWSYLQGTQAEGSPAAAAVAPLQLAAARTAPSTHCRSLGPFTDSAQMLSASAALTARGVVWLMRQSERTVGNGTWVYIDGMKNVADRQRTLQRLRRAGLQDVAEMADERYTGRISAGIFLDPKGAQDRAARVRAAGFEPVLEERQRTVAERWLDVEWNVGVTPTAPADLGIPASAGSAIDWVDCPTAAGNG